MDMKKTMPLKLDNICDNSLVPPFKSRQPSKGAEDKGDHETRERANLNNPLVNSDRASEF